MNALKCTAYNTQTIIDMWFGYNAGFDQRSQQTFISITCI